MHTLLDRQLRRHFGDPANVPSELRPFIAAVEESYIAGDDDRALLEHSMETVSGELVDRFKRLNNALSESHAAKEELNEAVSLLSATLDSTADGIFVSDRLGKMVQMNRKFIDLWRLPDSVIQAFDERGLEFILEHLADPSSFTKRNNELRHQPEKPSFDRITLTDGRIVERSSAPQRIGDEIVGRVWSFRDVTEQHTAAAALRRQALVFETITEGVVVVDPQGRIVDVNPAIQTIFGYSRDELIGRAPAMWHRPDVTPPTIDTIMAALRADGEWSGEYPFLAKDGRTGFVESTISTLRDATGKPISTIGVTRDITERRQMNQQLLQAQKLEAIGSLAAGVAHEINTPTQFVGDNVSFIGDGLAALAGVVGEARALAKAAGTHRDLDDAVAAFDRVAEAAEVDYLLSDLPRAAEQAREGCDRISGIVRAMRGFTHPGGAQRQLVDLNAAVRDTVAVCRNEWRYVATMTTEFDAEMPPVSCLPGELQQVVLNLVVNAAHAVAQVRADSGAPGHITVSTRRDGHWAEIRVRDDGIGIPDAIAAKVFDPFFTTKAVGTGTGQGLSIGHSTIVGKHHGTLTFEPADGQGTTFIIRIPIDGTTDIKTGGRASAIGELS